MSHVEPSKIESWLGHLVPDDHYTRLKVITGIKACLGDAGLDITFQWSGLPEHEFISLWNSAGKTTDFGESYLFSLAKKAGYTGSSTHNKGGQEKKVLTNVLPFEPAERLSLAAILTAWDRCETFTSHPYITAKKVGHLIPDDIRLEKYKGFSNLVIPVRCIQTSRIISSSTTKSYLKIIKATFPSAKVVIFCDGNKAGQDVFNECKVYKDVYCNLSPSYDLGKSIEDCWDIWDLNDSSLRNELGMIKEFVKKEAATELDAHA